MIQVEPKEGTTLTDRVSPKHPRASHFEKSGLFDRLSTFSELESRIAELSATDKGDAFEVFAEAYLATEKLVQATEVWPSQSIPIDVNQQMSLPASDMGIDGVFRDGIGKYSAYQVKFRTGRPSMSWGELSTFFGLSDRADTRVLFTNCSDLPAVVESRVGFYCIRGNDLDRLERRDFETISQWLKGIDVPRKTKMPWPHQEQAIQDIIHGLESSDRVTAVMACGTGKTLVSLWVAEQLRCQQILVLVPSLALMRQTLHEWLQETSWDRLSYRCVCSDPTVSRGLDELAINQADLDFPVNTSSDEVAEYIDQPFDGVRVVFSTYQSAHVVAEAMGGRYQFDLGVFDEAHKTAGRQGTRFSFALDDKNLPIKKRVFLTATPRHYNVLQRDKEGDAKLVYSMDVPESYGPIVHSLSFADAASKGISCGYKVIISVVTTDMVADALRRRGEVIVEGDAVRVRQVANQIALDQAVEEHGVKRIFTFHSTVASAKSFVAESGEGVNTHLTGFNAYHVNGKIPTARREAILGDFSRADCGLVSNARCLTEGVDLPAVDMVAFMSPKKSKVDIVQATGRAMRKDPENPPKETGYILLPLFIESSAGESLDDALERTDFEQIWDVLEAMQEQDKVLADVIQRMQVDIGRTGGFDESRFREKIEVLSQSISLEQLRKSITVRCIERLASTWYRFYGELQGFKTAYGHCNVPRHWPENPQLGRWVHTQRTRYLRRQLSEERIARLESSGFVWKPEEVAWEEMFAALKVYKAAHGHCNVPQKWPENPKLATWVNTQRTNHDRGQLSNERIVRLESLGFVWEPDEVAWQKKFADLQKYKAAYGHCNVPQKWPENPKLAAWVSTQRTKHDRGQLGKDRIARLEKLGIVWKPDEVAWEKNFSALQEYKTAYGHCNLPQRWPENPQLGRWVHTQRDCYKNGWLSEERISRLEALGFTWNLLDARWEEMFAALQQYQVKHGHCNVPYKNKGEARPGLGSWVTVQRRNYKNDSLDEERVERLEALGFTWNRLDAKWEEMFAALSSYKTAQGDCNVPRKWPHNPQLGTWVAYQRKSYMRKHLSEERIARLESIGFSFTRG